MESLSPAVVGSARLTATAEPTPAVSREEEGLDGGLLPRPWLALLGQKPPQCPPRPSQQGVGKVREGI